MKIKQHFLLSAAALIAASATLGAQAIETIELEIVTSGGHSYKAKQELGAEFEYFASGSIAGETPPQEYWAIRCDSPWGAIKYRVPLTSGPGYRLQAKDNRLLLQIVEHTVISKDETIASMSVHCIDTEPKQVMKSVIEIELKRGTAATQQLQLANGDMLKYRYTP